MVCTYDGEEEKQSEMTEIMSGAAGILVVILTGKKKRYLKGKQESTKSMKIS